MGISCCLRHKGSKLTQLANIKNPKSSIEETERINVIRSLSTSLMNFDESNSVKPPIESSGYPENNVKSWTSLISRTAVMGSNDRALAYFSQMRRAGIEPNERTFSISLGICGNSQRPDVGMSFHGLVLKCGLLRQLFVGSGLLTMYAKFDHLEQARRVFDEMLERDSVSWNSMISAYCQNGLFQEAIDVFCLLSSSASDWRMLVNNFTFATMFKACAGVGCSKIGKSVHGCVIKFGFDSDVFVSGSAVDMYSKCGCLDKARRVFDRLEERDLVAWNSMITGYAQNLFSWEVIELFRKMQYEGFLPNETTFSCVLKASALISESSVGRCFHAKILKCGVSSDVFVGTSLVDMYSKHLRMEDAERAFHEMTMKNLASFNVLITGYSLTGGLKQSLITYTNLLSDDLRPDYFTLTGLFSSLTVIGTLREGLQVHAHSIKLGLDSNVTAGNSLVNFYAKCGLMESATQAFYSLKKPNSVSWAGIISGFAQNGEDEKALEYFCEMCKLSEKPDEFSFTSVLKALASGALMDQGRHIHAFAIKMGLELTVFVGTALLDMYSKCGMVEDSDKVFKNMSEKNVVSWNSMITGYAQNGFTSKSLTLFEEMVKSDMIPTSITFTGLLLACSHEGLVEEGKRYYNSMVSDYRIPPSIEHCTCMVDLLGRAGQLDDAEKFILNSSFFQEVGLWRSLLASCGVHKNTDVAVRVAEQCLRLEPHDSSTYVILSNIYASKHLWDDVTRIRDLMKDIGIEKEPGCSWVEVRNEASPSALEGKSVSTG
ncbi:hypothetical protein Scep_026402 [Stephania cephalantha]|uniref:Pentatricopeptide repeat-containing protein n=1 Tax=Stephania cephalantha TaxID=152367 RepID=A0AAP0HN53_9MAGN